MENKELAKIPETGLKVFSSGESFELAQRMAKLLSSSNIVPKAYQGNIPNCIIALEMSSRMGVPPIMVMQNLDIIQGSPSWSSTFLISAINSSGKFDALKFRITNNGKKKFSYTYYSGFGQNRKPYKKEVEHNDLSCVAWTKDKSGEVLESPAVTMQMVFEEGWYDKEGSKWKTMPELMIRYRAASFFSRLFCPEITMGMHTAEEIIDITYEEVSGDDKKKALKEKKADATQQNLEMP